VNFPGCLPTAISVGAIDATDVRWYYSGRGADLSLVAPSGNSNFLGDVWSIDRMSSFGFNPNVVTGCPPESNDENYFCRFGGTSAAAPVVSGTAALILAYDQTLTSAEVYEILEGSAETQLDWGTITPPDTAYGYGRVDAFRAILSLARGDINSDGSINNADITALIDYIYMGGAGGFPDVRLGNCNCSGDGKINLSDLTTLIDYVYVNHTPLPLPCFNYLYPNQ
jgi:subtilisin family serine protease